MSGGGTKGAYETGVLEAMADLMPQQEMAYDVVAGVSIGAINANSLAVNKIGQEKEAI